MNSFGVVLELQAHQVNNNICDDAKNEVNVSLDLCNCIP